MFYVGPVWYVYNVCILNTKAKSKLEMMKKKMCVRNLPVEQKEKDFVEMSGSTFFLFLLASKQNPIFLKKKT